jgi:hypothetical protein
VNDKEAAWRMAQKRDQATRAIRRLLELAEARPDLFAKIDVTPILAQFARLEMTLGEAMRRVEEKACQEISNSSERREILNNLANIVGMQFMQTRHAVLEVDKK